MAELLGRICTKIAGREGNRKAVIVDILKGNFVIIDGDVKRRKCNLAHLELSDKLLKIKKGISSEELKELLAKEGIDVAYNKKVKTKKEKPGSAANRIKPKQPVENENAKAKTKKTRAKQ